MALHKTSRLGDFGNTADGLFPEQETAGEEIMTGKDGIGEQPNATDAKETYEGKDMFPKLENGEPKDMGVVHTFTKKEEARRPTKKRIDTKSRTYTIDDPLYYRMKATVKVLRDNDVRSEENDSLITESAFIRKAIRNEMARLEELNGKPFADEVQRILDGTPKDVGAIKY